MTYQYFKIVRQIDRGLAYDSNMMYAFQLFVSKNFASFWHSLYFMKDDSTHRKDNENFDAEKLWSEMGEWLRASLCFTSVFMRF